jgi:hypothetical protein
MSPFLRAIARLALGTGPVLEPLLPSELVPERGLDEGEVASDSGSPPPPAERIVERSSTEHVSIVHPTRITNRQTHVHHHEDHSVTPVEGSEHSEVPVGSSTVSVERTVETRQAGAEVHERRETLRALLREATEIHRERVVQRVESIERSVSVPAARARETGSAAAGRRPGTEVMPPRATAGVPKPTGGDPRDDVRVEPLIEISIGRIEVKAERAERSSSPEPAAKPSGVLALNDYLRERSQGSL